MELFLIPLNTRIIRLGVKVQQLSSLRTAFVFLEPPYPLQLVESNKIVHKNVTVLTGCAVNSSIYYSILNLVNNNIQ